MSDINSTAGAALPPSVANDLLLGWNAIHDFVGHDIPLEKLKRAKYRSDIPIHRRNGLGTYSLRSQLGPWLKNMRESPAEGAA